MYLQSLTTRLFLFIHLNDCCHFCWDLRLPLGHCWTQSWWMSLDFIQYVFHLSAPDSALVFLFETHARPENNSDWEVPPPSNDLQFQQKFDPIGANNSSRITEAQQYHWTLSRFMTVVTLLVICHLNAEQEHSSDCSSWIFPMNAEQEAQQWPYFLNLPHWTLNGSTLATGFLEFVPLNAEQEHSSDRSSWNLSHWPLNKSTSVAGLFGICPTEHWVGVQQ